ncbi:MAG: 30S ribosomal protein S6 [Candidatus Latescibacterota bacterium]
MNNYECTIIVTSDTGDDVAKSAAKKYANVITTGGGELTQLEDWGRRKLAYEINHHQEGHYVFYKMRCDNPVLQELNRLLRLDETILRHMIVRDPLATGEEAKIDPEEALSAGTGEKEEV